MDVQWPEAGLDDFLGRQIPHLTVMLEEEGGGENKLFVRCFVLSISCMCHRKWPQISDRPKLIYTILACSLNIIHTFLEISHT